nr:AP-4 complex subunit mu [Ipomoea batatas]
MLDAVSVSLYPVFIVCSLQNVDGVNYFHVKVVGLLFAATTRTNVSPSLVLELLQRIARVTKDYLGILNEDSLRKNFVLVYELLDEVIDFGYVQTTSTEVLKSYIFNEPIVVDGGRLPPIGPAAIFMGYILTSEIDGTIQMKSYLSGNPEIRLALNEDLSIGRGGRSIYDYGGSSGAGAVTFDDCNFHESVHLDSFDMDKTLTLVPPDGEFPVMNYRITQEFKPPFRINALIEEAGSLKIVGGSECTLRAKLTFSQESHGNITKEAGPVSMTFTIPMYNPSRLQVKYLQIAKTSKSYNPYRWVRYVTQTNSYVARI